MVWPEWAGLAMAAPDPYATRATLHASANPRREVHAGRRLGRDRPYGALGCALMALLRPLKLPASLRDDSHDAAPDSAPVPLPADEAEVGHAAARGRSL